MSGQLGYGVPDDDDVIDPDDDVMAQVLKFLRKRISGDDLSTIETIFRNADNGGMAGDGAIGRRGGTISMDSRQIIRDINELRAAEAEVLPHVGAVMGCDSAAGVYKTALQRLGKNIAGLPPVAMRVAFRGNAGAPRNAAPLALDAKGAAARSERFPNGNRLSRHG